LRRRDRLKRDDGEDKTDKGPLQRVRLRQRAVKMQEVHEQKIRGVEHDERPQHIRAKLNKFSDAPAQASHGILVGYRHKDRSVDQRRYSKHVCESEAVFGHHIAAQAWMHK